MRDATVCTSKGAFVQGDAAQVKRFLQNNAEPVWLDLLDPTPDDIEILQNDFGFHPLAIEDATRRPQRPKVDSYGRYYFVVFYCVGLNEQTGRIETSPLYMFVASNYLVTVHHDPIAPIPETVRRWHEPNSPLGDDIGALIYALLDAIVDDYFPVMDQVAELIEDLEDAIFERFDDGALQTIFQLKKDLLNMRRVVGPERDVLNVMLRRDIPVFAPEDVAYLQDVYDHIVRVSDNLDTYRDLLSSVLDSYLSMQSNRLNQILKVLTVASIVLMSSSLVAGIYGMNFEYMPELHWRFGYAWALSLMIGIAGGLIVLFRRMKWL